MSVVNICRKPAVSVPRTASVREALEKMTSEKVGAVVVVDEERPVGMFTRLDAIERVVLKKLPLESTDIASVMTTPVETLSEATSIPEALHKMVAWPFNHVPIVDADERIVGLATTKPLLKQTIERLSNELDSLETFFTSDGIGG